MKHIPVNLMKSLILAQNLGMQQMCRGNEMQSVEYCQSEGEDGCRNLASEGELVWAAWLATFYGSTILRY